jgi:hypothetical protein
MGFQFHLLGISELEHAASIITILISVIYNSEYPPTPEELEAN